MNELGIEIEDNMILEARQIVFNDACRQYFSELSNANIDIHPNLQLNNRRMGPTDSYIAKDLINLLKYVSGISTHFPKSVLSELKTFISINKIKATDSNETLHSETRANCELTQVTTDRTRTTGHKP